MNSILLYCTTLPSDTVHKTPRHCTATHPQSRATLLSIELHWTQLHNVVLHCTLLVPLLRALHCVKLNYTMLYIAMLVPSSEQGARLRDPQTYLSSSSEEHGNMINWSYHHHSHHHHQHFHWRRSWSSDYGLYWHHHQYPKVRVQKKIRDYLGIFPNMGGGVFPIPKTQNQKKVPLNHPKITQKTN